jgi:signal transduction histidine kinase
MSDLIIILIAVIEFLIGLWVFLKDRKNRVNIAFFGVATSSVFWIFSTLISWHCSSATQNFWDNILYIGPSFVVGFFFLLIISLSDHKPLSTRQYFYIFFPPFVLSLLALSRLIIKESSGPLTFQTGIGYPIFFVYLISYFGLCFVKLFQKYLKSVGIIKTQIEYILAATLTAGAVGVFFNLILPTMGIAQFTKLGASLSCLIFTSIIAYTIVTRQLFGIRVILTQALVGVIAILLLVQSVTAVSNWLDFSWKFALFLLFLFFGYLLIQSVIREIERGAELEHLYKEVERLSRAKSEFISIVSHQLRTPLTAMKSYIYMILEGRYGKVEEKERGPLEKVFQSDERLLTLVNDLLDLSRIESGTIKLELEKTSLPDIISSTLDELRIKANEKNIYLKVEKVGSEPLPEALVDSGKVRQVIMNIVDNCIKYTESGGVTVRAEIVESETKDSQRSVMIKIKDTGEGMTKEDMEHLFESFSRGAVGESKWTGGAGLGLYIARKFTELHGGKVWAESEGEGKGSTFYIELPVK